MSKTFNSQESFRVLNTLPLLNISNYGTQSEQAKFLFNVRSDIISLPLAAGYVQEIQVIYAKEMYSGINTGNKASGT